MDQNVFVGWSKKPWNILGFFSCCFLPVLMMEDHTEYVYKSVHTGYVVLTNIAACLDTIWKRVKKQLVNIPCQASGVASAWCRLLSYAVCFLQRCGLSLVSSAIIYNIVSEKVTRWSVDPLTFSKKNPSRAIRRSTYTHPPSLAKIRQRTSEE